MEKFVTLDFCRDAGLAIVCWFDAYDLALAPDVDVSGACDLFGEGNNEFDGGAGLECGLGKKIEPAITDISRVGNEFR